MTPDGDKLSECDWEHLASNEWEERLGRMTEEEMMEARLDQQDEAERTPASIPLVQFITKHGIKFECKRVDSRPDGAGDWKPDTRHFKCRISAFPRRGPRRSFGLYFSQGSAHTEAPTLADVLDCLASDASGYENARQQRKHHPAQYESFVGFENWADEYGYDRDSRKAEKTFRAIKRQAEQIKRTIGQEAYEELLWKTERL